MKLWAFGLVFLLTFISILGILFTSTPFLRALYLIAFILMIDIWYKAKYNIIKIVENITFRDVDVVGDSR